MLSFRSLYALIISELKVKITDNTSVKAKTGDEEKIMDNLIWLNCKTVYKSLHNLLVNYQKI
jgi:hypothetical protein